MSLLRRSLMNQKKQYDLVATFIVDENNSWLFSYAPSNYDSSNNPDYVKVIKGLYVSGSGGYFTEETKTEVKIVDKRTGKIIFNNKYDGAFTINIALEGVASNNSNIEETEKYIKYYLNQCELLHLQEKIVYPYYFDVYIKTNVNVRLSPKEVIDKSTKSGNTYIFTKQLYSVQKQTDNISFNTGLWYE